MFCSNCGQKLQDTARFCVRCGAPTGPAAGPAPVPPPVSPAAAPDPVPPERPAAAPAPVPTGPDGVDLALKEMNPGRKSGRFAGFLIGVVAAAVVFAVVLALTVGLPWGDGDAAAVEGAGFDTAEDAAEAYLAALQEGDLDGMLSAFAMETYVENMDLAAYVDRPKVYHSVMPLPGDSGYVARLNLEKRRSDVTNTITYQYWTLTDPDSPILQLAPLPLEEESAASFLQRLEPPRAMETLSGLTVGDFRRPELVSQSYGSTSNRKNLENRALVYGAEEIQPLAVEVTAGGREYLFCPDAIRYGERWYLLNLNGNLSILLSGSSTAGGFIPMEELP